MVAKVNKVSLCKKQISSNFAGVIDTDDVLRRFLSQRDTKSVLEKMKTLSEREKEALIKRKEEIIAELETHKFADVKDQER